MGDGTVWWFNRTTLNQFDPRTKTTRAYAVDTSALGSFLTPQLTSPQISGDGYAWFIANGIPRQLGRLKLSTGVTEFFDQPFKFNLQNYVLTSQGPWLTYTPYQTNDTAIGQFDPVAKVLSKTLTPPQKYGFVGPSRLLALGENAVVFWTNGRRAGQSDPDQHPGQHQRQLLADSAAHKDLRFRSQHQWQHLDG